MRTGTRLLVLLCMLFPATLMADFVGTVSTNIVDTQRNGLAGVKVTAEFDANWGRSKPEEIEAFKRANGPFPDVKVSGELTTDATGVIKLPVTVTTSGEGKLPTTTIYINRQSLTVDYVMVKLTLTKEGHRNIVTQTMVTNGESDNNGRWQMTMSRLYSFKAQLVHMADRKPVANAKVQVIGQRFVVAHGVTSEPLEVTTDANGNLELSDEQCAPQMRLLMQEDDLAFAEVSTVWRGLKLREGENDGGTLVVVPGGSIKFQAVHADTGEDMPTRFYLRSTNQRSGFTFNSNDKSSPTLIKGLPEGTFHLSANVDGFFWGIEHADIAVKQGETTDLGKLSVEPHQSIEVFAVDEGGTGIQAYTVEAEQISGFTPNQRFNVPMNGGKPRPWIVISQCTPEKNKVMQLARGRWKVTVRAEGFSPGSTEIDVPAEDPVFVKMNQGGKLEVTTDKNDFEWEIRFETLIAISKTAPAWAKLKGLSGLEIASVIQSVDQTGVFLQTRDHFNRATPFSALPPDTYTVVGIYSRENSMRADDILVRKGETTNLVMRKSAAQLTVKVLHGTAPLASELIYLRPQQRWDQQGQAPKTVSASTDANGLVSFNDLPGGSYELLTKRQHDWINSAPMDRFGGSRALPNGMAPRITPGYGDRLEVEVNTQQPEYVWVSVKVDTPKNVAVGEVHLSDLRKTFGLNRISPSPNGDRYEFGPLHAGFYEFALQVMTGNRRGASLLRLFEVTGPDAQLFEIDLKIAKLEVKVKPPKGFDEHEVNVYLQQNHEYQWASYNNPGAHGQADAKGTIKFDDLTEGPYRVVAWAAKDRGGITYITSEDIELKGSKKVSLKFDERIGALRLQFKDSMRFDSEASMRIELMDGDKPAPMGNPEVMFRQNSGITLAAVAKGKYTLRISGVGFEPYTQEGVEIDTGGTTQLDINLVPTCYVVVKLMTQKIKGIDQPKPEIEYLDADSKLIDVGDIDWRTTFSSVQGPEGTWLVFSNVPSRCVRIRFKATGYKLLTVDIKPLPNQRTEVESNIEPE